MKDHRAVGFFYSTLAYGLVLAACDGPQSALEPAGRAAERIATLFWWMTGGAVLVWAAVIGLALYAVRVPPESHSRRHAGLLIIGGGAVVPTVVIAVLVIYGLAPIPVLLAPAPENSLRITVSGEQWWWRVQYHAGGDMVVLANEIRLPVGEPVQFRLESPDVIHSFWIPSLGGKIDMIPGRVTRLSLTPTKTGVFRGVCAEYCGTAHALMSFYVVVEEKETFNRWLAHQQAPALPPSEAAAARGQELFLANGCGACHRIRGTAAKGVLGPDLTHVGSRLSIGAGMLPNNSATQLRWIARTEQVKPGVLMPSFAMLPDDDLKALAAYMVALQ